MADEENFYVIRSYREDSRSGELGEKNDGSWILFSIFWVSDTDRSSGNVNLVLRRDNRLEIKI